MKKPLSILLVAAVLAVPSVHAEDEIRVIAEDREIEFDVPPQITNGRTLVPMRKIFEVFGAEIEWFEKSQLILATRNADVVAMVIGRSEITVTNMLSGKVKTIELDVPPQISDGRTLVPIRAVSEALGMDVKWNEETKVISISRRLI